MYAIRRMGTAVPIASPIIVIDMELPLVIQIRFALVPINGQEIHVRYAPIIIGLILISNVHYALLDITAQLVQYLVDLFVLMEQQHRQHKSISIQFVLVIMDGRKIYTVNAPYVLQDILD